MREFIGCEFREGGDTVSATAYTLERERGLQKADLHVGKAVGVVRSTGEGWEEDVRERYKNSKTKGTGQAKQAKNRRKKVGKERKEAKKKKKKVIAERRWKECASGKVKRRGKRPGERRAKTTIKASTLTLPLNTMAHSYVSSRSCTQITFFVAAGSEWRKSIPWSRTPVVGLGCP
jgi:hypothetical protein